jgi:aspartate aminotransferase
MSIEKLDSLRYSMKIITQQIVSLINERMEIAKKIGEIKQELNLDIIDDKIEQEIKSYILKESDKKGLDPEFAGRMINLLINESINIQKSGINRKIQSNNPNKFNNNLIYKEIEKKNQPSSSEDIFSNIKIKTHMDVFNKAKQLDSLGQKIIHMEVGEPDFSPPNQVKEELSVIYDKHKYHYTETAGINSLRKRLAIYLTSIQDNKTESQIYPENIIATVGGRFAIFCTFSSILKPGDEIIVIEPAWPAYIDIANYLGVKTKIIRTNLEEKWEPDISAIENSINVNTKIICLNYPNNPTGKILNEEKLQYIVEIAKKNNLFILSDEVYCNFAYKKFSSILNTASDKSIMIGSFSKTYSMTGFRVGFAYSENKNLIDKLIKIQSLTLTSVPEPMQLCASAALSHNPSQYSQTMKKRIEFVCSRLKKMPFEFFFPDGAMYVYAKINEELAIDDLTLIEKLLQKGVAVAPGSGFGDNYKKFIRISTCVDEDRLNAGLNIIDQTVNSL